MPSITQCLFQVVLPVPEIIVRDPSIPLEVRLVPDQHRGLVAEEAESEETSTEIGDGDETEDGGGEVESAEEPEDEGEGVVEEGVEGESAENVPDEEVVEDGGIEGAERDPKEHGHEVPRVLVSHTHSCKGTVVISS